MSPTKTVKKGTIRATTIPTVPASFLNKAAPKKTSADMKSAEKQALDLLQDLRDNPRQATASELTILKRYRNPEAPSNAFLASVYQAAAEVGTDKHTNTLLIPNRQADAYLRNLPAGFQNIYVGEIADTLHGSLARHLYPALPFIRLNQNNNLYYNNAFDLAIVDMDSTASPLVSANMAMFALRPGGTAIFISKVNGNINASANTAIRGLDTPLTVKGNYLVSKAQGTYHILFTNKTAPYLPQEYSHVFATVPAGSLYDEVVRNRIQPDQIILDRRYESSMLALTDLRVKNYQYLVDADQVYQRVNSRLLLTSHKGTPLDRLRRMIRIREAAVELVNIQNQEPFNGALFRAKQRELNDMYDTYVHKMKYGFLSNQTNKSLFKEDYGAAIILALEVVDEDSDEVQKAPIFYKRIVKKREFITSCDNPVDAFYECLDAKGKVDIEYISKLCGESPEGVIKCLNNSLIYLEPSLSAPPDKWQWVDARSYLAGDIRDKLSTVRQLERLNPALQVNREALEKALPSPIPYSKITVSLGAPWIPIEVYEQFLNERICNLPYPANDNWGNIQIAHCPGEPVSWSYQYLPYIPGSNSNVHTTYGTSRIDALHIFIKTMNYANIIIYDTVRDADGKDYKVRNNEETLKAMEKSNLQQREFLIWIDQNPSIKHRLVNLFNEQHNNYVVPVYENSKLTLPGLSSIITLDQYQIDAISRGIYENGMLLAYPVGSGKTFISIAIIQELRRIGRIKKPILVVPNNVVSAWASEYLRLYPNANVLAIQPDEMSPVNQHRMITRMMFQEFDAIIIPQSTFERHITIPFETIREYQLFLNDGKDVSLLTNPQDKNLQKLYDRCYRATCTLQSIGADYLVYDESHHCKNLASSESRSPVRGVSVTGSTKATHLKLACEYFNKLHQGHGGYLFCTGSPITNSITEMYSLIRYFRERVLKKLGLASLRSWLKTFAITESEWEIPPEGLSEDGAGYRPIVRISRFGNLSVLMSIVHQFMEIKTKDQLDIDLPDVVRITDISQPTEIQKEYMQFLTQRANHVRGTRSTLGINSLFPIPKNDNMLLITNHGRQLALDEGLVLGRRSTSKGTKLYACVNRCAKFYHQYKVLRLTQIIFCDNGVTSQTGHSTYQVLKTMLIDAGIKEEEICFADGIKTQSQSRAMQQKMRTGRIRVLVGSTRKIGTGINVQNRLMAIHHLDVPWRPDDIEQREGRIERRGNQNCTIYIIVYITERTFDSYLWQLISNKAKMIAQLLRGDYSGATIEDNDTKVFSYSELKALAAGNTDLLERSKTEAELARLLAMKLAHDNDLQKFSYTRFTVLPSAIAVLEERIAAMKLDLADQSACNGDEELVINGVHLPTSIDIAKDLNNNFIKPMISHVRKNHSNTVIGKYNGLQMELATNGINRYVCVRLISVHGYQYGSLHSENSCHSLNDIIHSVRPIYQSIEREYEKRIRQLAEYQREMDSLDNKLTSKFPYEKELEKTKVKLNQLDVRIAKAS